MTQTPATPPTPTPPSEPTLTVLYDGACPLCRREIGVYRDLRPVDNGLSVCYADISDASVPVPPGTTRAGLLARFHVNTRMAGC